MKLVKSLLPAFALGALLFAGAPACTGDERLEPVPTATVTPTPTTSHDPPDPVPPKRTVTTRNPFGNVAATENLLWDGDFEWTSPFTDQYGWIEPPSNPTVSDVVVGAACKSGVKCIRLKKAQDVVGIAVSSTKPFLSASVWVRFEPPSDGSVPACDEAEASLFDLGGLETPDEDFDLSPTSATPDEAGWCKLAGVSPKRANKTYLYVRNRSMKTSMLVDDAVILASDSDQPLSGPSPFASRRAPDHGAAIARARAAVLATRLPQDDKPNPARDAMRAHSRSK